MNNVDVSTTKSQPRIYSKISADTYEGIYHSNSVNKSPAEVFSFCKNEENLKKVLVDLPEKIKNFLDLEFVSASPTTTSGEMFQVRWQNRKTTDVQGTLTFNLSPSSHGKGTVLIANAIFADYTMDNDEPSDLINIFLKRMKALLETGELATTKGQPNGKDEKEMKETLKH